MSERIKDRYGHYPKKKEKKHFIDKEGRFLKRTYGWLKWKIADSGEASFHRSCLGL